MQLAVSKSLGATLAVTTSRMSDRAVAIRLANSSDVVATEQPIAREIDDRRSDRQRVRLGQRRATSGAFESPAAGCFQGTCASCINTVLRKQIVV